MLFHVFTHIETQEFYPHLCRKLPGDFSFTHPGRPGKEERTSRLLRLTQAGTGATNRLTDLGDSLILTKHLTPDSRVEVLQLASIRLG